MANSKQTSGKSFLVQGSILAVAGVITKIIGAVYRVPLVNIMGDTGMGYYGVAFQIYAIALTLTSYSLPLAVSKLVSARVAVGQYRNAYKVFRGALAFAITVGGTAALIIFFGAGFIASELMAMSLSAYALRVLAPCILVVALLGVFRGFFQGNGSMIPTAFSQVLEQIVNAVVSVLGAYLLLKAGRAASDGSLGYAFAAAGGTLGTVAGAASALLLLVFIFSVYRRVLKRQMRKYLDPEAGELSEDLQDPFYHHRSGALKFYRLQPVRRGGQRHVRFYHVGSGLSGGRVRQLCGDPERKI